VNIAEGDYPPVDLWCRCRFGGRGRRLSIWKGLGPGGRWRGSFLVFEREGFLLCRGIVRRGFEWGSTVGIHGSGWDVFGSSSRVL
jgi:hypothetical protein